MDDFGLSCSRSGEIACFVPQENNKARSLFILCNKSCKRSLFDQDGYESRGESRFIKIVQKKELCNY